jgi:serine/threonine-protein kinase
VLKIFTASLVSLSLGCLVINYFVNRPNEQNKSISQEQKLQKSSLTIGILNDPSRYNSLATYLRSQFGNKVQITIDGNESIPYGEVRNRLVRKEWDIAFTLSPMLSVAAKENGYTFAARMFPKNPPYYQGALFVKSTSPIQSLNDLKPTTTIALGDFNSASSFYMPAYDLSGKILRVDMGHRGQEIRDLVKTGKAEIGAGAYDTIKDDTSLRVIHISRQIPGSNVYLSPNLSEPDRDILKKVLLNAPIDIKNHTNYDAGQEPGYFEFIKISQKAEEVLKCADFQNNPVKFFCSNSSSIQNHPKLSSTSDVIGRINGWSRKDSNTEQFSLSGQDNKVYLVVVPRLILNQVPSAFNPLALQNKDVRIVGVAPKEIGNKILELQITNPQQVVVLSNVL